MNVSLFAWVGLILVLCVTTFGLWWCVTVSVSVPVFLVGGLTFLYLKHADSSQKYYTALYRSRQETSRPGLSKVMLFGCIVNLYCVCILHRLEKTYISNR